MKYKQKITSPAGDNGRKIVKIMVPLKFLSNFLGNIEMPLINCKSSITLTWSANCVLVSNTAIVQATTYAITDTKLYVSVVTLSTKGNAKLLHQLKLGFKGTTNWNKYQSKVTIQAPNPYLDYLMDPSFLEVNRRFVLSFEVNADRTVQSEYYIPTLEIKDCNFIIDGRYFFNKPIKIIYSIDISKQQALDAYPKAIEQINFTRNLAREGNANTTFFFIIGEANETILHFSTGTLKILWILLYDLATRNSFLFWYNISIKWLNMPL